MKMKVLFENTQTEKSFKAGHGLSLLLDFSGKKYLFDTGANQKMIHNARLLNEPLNDLAGIILSHGHSDHTGGLKYLPFEETNVYIASDANLARYLKIGPKLIYVGIPRSELSQVRKT
jgi:7,8-dihydropterin-6-yl-methyl-4-(beta-D-ribofuranosyl)aminobenzene 5'-phosphate synthase